MSLLAAAFRKTILPAFAVFALCCLAFLLYFSPVVLQGMLLAPAIDGLRVYVPAFFLSGRLWTDKILCGFPLFADPQFETWYPVSLLHHLGVSGWNWKIIFPYAAAASFTFGCLRRLTQSKLAALVGAIVFSLSGVLIGNMRHVTMVQTACWLPLVIWSLFELRQKLSPGWLVLATLGTTLMALGGFPQTLAYCLTLAATFVLFQAVGCGTDKKVVIDWKFALVGGGVLALGLAAAAIQLIPTAELAKLTPRIGLSRQLYNEYRIAPVQLVGLILPGLFGLERGTIYGYDYVGSSNLVSAICYVGLMPLILIPLSFFSGIGRKHSWFWLAVAVIAALLALGDYTPVGYLGYYYPLYGNFRAPSKHLIEMSLAVAVLAGLGVAALQKRSVDRRTLTLVLAGAAVVFTAVVIFGISLLPGIGAAVKGAGAGNFPPLWWQSPALLVPLATFAVSIGALALFFAKPEARLFQLVLVGALCIDLGAFGQSCEWRLHPGDPRVLTAPDFAQTYAQQLQKFAQRGFNITGAQGGPGEMPSILAAVWGVPMVNSSEALMPARTRRYFCMAEGGFVLGCNPFVSTEHRLDIAAVRFVFLPAYIRQLQADVSRWHRLPNLPSAFVLENSAVMPRVWLAARTKMMSDSDILHTLRNDAAFHPSLTALVEESTGLETLPERPVVGTVNLQSLSDDRMVLDVNLTGNQPAFLITSDAYYPGWQAAVDGRSTKIYPVDYLFRGVVVPPGRHTISFTLKPASLYAGAAITLLSFLLLLGSAVAIGRRARAASSQTLDGDTSISRSSTSL